MTKKSTQSATRCARRLPPNPRTPRDRTRLFMPARISDEIRARVRELLMQTQAQAGSVAMGPIMARLKEQKISLSRATLDKEAYALEVAGLILIDRQMGGRPKLTDGARGKTWSPHRARVLELHARGMKPAQIAKEIPLTRQGIERIIKADSVENEE